VSLFKNNLNGKTGGQVTKERGTRKGAPSDPGKLRVVVGLFERHSTWSASRDVPGNGMTFHTKSRS